MNNKRVTRKSHTAERRNEWLGVIHVTAGIVGLLAPAGTHDRATVQATVNLAMRPLFDRHYEGNWPNSAPVPYTSIYETRVGGDPGSPVAYIKLSTWPGERTTVDLGDESPARVRSNLAPGQDVTTDYESGG